MSNLVNVQIKGQTWKIKLWPDAQYVKKFGSDSDAITFTDKRQIHFSKRGLNIGVVRHELMHAIFAEAHVESAHLNADQIEEVACSIVQYQWNILNNLTETIIDEFLKPREA